ncbi:hypothetical protein LGM43_31140 [Burkholderia seminalis]|uniref:Uncharacterized protein n=6 Tax=Burkholderia cepacia complex TaxID=87882 RepID=A0AAP4R840_9BURK|nr:MULTISPECIES: hypothetical protein [Burkholderia]EKS9799720.1 hypothetical protein [Burkholderia cepacia]EKS9806769.1 hypothetical protein [Burkholderia cepacia]EKS9814238.1 hypothetical protein [Burkholderia cepacia]EKS9821382.1 hypothetical protein [Burkholderia cepacia]EKS9828975.1 hypothetical protein [Burkholderia cepacia]
MSSNSQRENAVSTIGLAVFGGRDLAAADHGLRNSGLRTEWVVRAGRRLRNGAGDAPRGDCAKKSAGRALARWLGRVDGRDGGGRRARATQCVHCVWVDGPRRAAAAEWRGRRPARRQHESRGAGGSASGLVGPAVATVATAVLELRNASIALWLGGPRGAVAAEWRG